MTQMRVAGCAQHLGPAHEKAAILFLGDGFAILRRIKAWPTRAAFKLRFRIEQSGATADAVKCPRPFGKVVVGARTLCPVFARDLVREIA